MKSVFLYGKALKCFNENNYTASASLFEKVIELNPKVPKIELVQYYIGRSYLALGNNKGAKSNFSMAYDVFVKRVKQFRNSDDIHQLKFLAIDYIQVLGMMGHEDMVKSIKEECNELGLF